MRLLPCRVETRGFMRIRVPATSANLGPGFDTLGMALQFYNYFEAHPAEKLTVSLSPGTCVEVSDLTLAPEDNLMAKAYAAYFRFRQSPPIPAQLIIEAHIPLSRGLGSSSSAIAAGLFLADQHHPEPLGKAALVPWAIKLEGHPDNVVPALLGGVRFCWGTGTSFQLAWPADWKILLVIPPDPLSTEQARRSMPAAYTLEQAVQNLRGIGSWVYAVMQEDVNLFRQALASDTLHEPARGQWIAEFALVKALIQQTDALGCIISGSGSTLAVFSPTAEVHQTVKSVLKEQTEALAHCRIIGVQPDTTGTQSAESAKSG